MLAIVSEGRVVFLAEGGGEATTTESTETEPNPIMPTPKEMAWGFGSFLVLFLLMRYWLYPRMKKGLDERAAKIQGDLDAAEAAVVGANTARADYQAGLADARAEAARLVETARAEVEQVRAEKVAALNRELAALRAETNAEIEAARQAASGQIRSAVTEVAAGAASRVVGREIGVPVAQNAVDAYLRSEGVSR